jgi:hypothetical protein
MPECFPPAAPSSTTAANRSPGGQDCEVSQCRSGSKSSSMRTRRVVANERTWKLVFGSVQVRTCFKTCEVLVGKTDGVTCLNLPSFSMCESEYCFIPSWSNLGIKLATSSQQHQWIPTSLRPSFIIPDDARIFKLCMDAERDNTADILATFAQGRASPFDTNTHGQTLLHVSWLMKWNIS